MRTVDIDSDSYYDVRTRKQWVVQKSMHVGHGYRLEFDGLDEREVAILFARFKALNEEAARGISGETVLVTGHK